MEFRRAKLVPELIITNMAASKRFWVEICGFSIAYSREEEGFAYLDLHGSQIMLDELGEGRKWITGPLEAPLGRGVNFEIEVPDLSPLLENLARVGWPLFMEPEEKWYRRDAVEVGVRQFLVQDPDGYLLRFQSSLGERPFAR
ncbi:VOC family protein [Achromobacter xylosoxidans]